ncbi:MAG: DNA endonuclease [Cyanobacteria bacterium J06641_5]
MDFDVSSKVERRGVLAGMLLGAGRKRGPNFFIQHPAHLRDYVCFKQALLEDITQKPVSLREIATARRGQRLLCLAPKLVPLTRVMVKRRYQGDRAWVTRPFLNTLTVQGLAIWLMDCGSQRLKKGSQNRVRALEVVLDARVSWAENQEIATYFAEVWGFRWGLARSRERSWLRLGTREGKRFLQFLAPYWHESHRLYNALMQGQATDNVNGRHLQIVAPAVSFVESATDPSTVKE